MTEPVLMAEYVVVMRAQARLMLDLDEPIILSSLSSWGDISIVISTRHVDEGFEAAIPRELLIAVRGAAPSIEDALGEYHVRALTVAAIVAFCGNAAVEAPEPYLAYDDTPGELDREFMQVLHEAPPEYEPKKRPLPGRQTAAFFGHLSRLPGSRYESLVAIFAHYSAALNGWFLGGEAIALTYLWLAAEALAYLVIDVELARNESLEEIADDYGMSREGGVAKRKLRAFLRWKIGFAGDQTLHDKVKEISDDNEHGSLSLHEAQTMAKEAAPKAFSALRAGIPGFVDSEGGETALLNNGDYRLPFDLSDRRILLGRLTGETSNLAAEGEAHPRFKWTRSVESVVRTPEGILSRNSLENLEPLVAKGVTPVISGYAIRGRPDGSAQRPPTILEATIYGTEGGEPVEYPVEISEE